MNIKPRILVLAGLAILGSAAPALAQSTCELSLQENKTLYREGKLPDARRAAEACLAGQPSRDEKLQARAALAKIDLAEDDLAAARRRIEDLLRDEPAFDLGSLADSPRFLRLVEQVRRDTSSVQVSSVSKTPESLREAPATVEVITAEEIRRRGYRDLPQLLEDLSGFDISRTNGLPYASFYQRGYRSDLTARTQLMVDGVEENELWTGIAYLSRQYPLSNIDRVEVIYGPASTMYGANAFAGVINVITRDAASYLQGNRRFGAEATAASGSRDTQSLDSTLAGRTANSSVSWTLTARSFQSDEMDLSRYPQWDYSADTVDYRALLDVQGTDAQGRSRAETFLSQLQAGNRPLPESSPFYQIVRDEQGTATAIRLTEAGLRRVRELDRAALANVDGTSARFTDSTKDWGLHGKLEVANLVLGFQTWRQSEGANPSFSDRGQAAGRSGMLWIPEQTWLYAKYERPLSTRGLSMSFFSRYKLHQLADPSATNIFTGYQNGKLGLVDLSHEAAPTWETRYFYQSNTQFANELSFAYSGSPRLSAVGGVEIRNSSIQGNYVLSDKPEPAETGKDDSIPGGNRFNVMDLAVYAQLSYRLRPDLRAVVGGRLDNNRVRESKGYGSVLSPRLALIYTHRGLVLKGIYSEAFQDASNFQKYVRVVPSSVGNPDLTPERAKNIELSAGWQPSKSLAFEITGYDARYSNIPQLQPVPCTVAIAGECKTAVINQFQPVGAREIRGVQAKGSWTRGRSSLTANYTYTDPVNTKLGVRVGDIASHHFNLIGTAGLGEHFDVTARLNAVSARRTGRGTDVDANPNTSIPGYAVVNTALTWEDPLPHVSLQLLVENLLDRKYGDPGIRRADGITYAAEVPQPGRGIHLRLKVSF